MVPKIYINVFLIILYSSTEAIMPIKLIKTYTKFYSLSSLNLYCCFGRKQIISLKKNMQDTLQHVYDIRNIDTSKTLITNYDRRLGMILDLDCPNAERIIQKPEIFNDTHFWLMITENYDNAIKTLEKAPLNINAELRLAYINNEDVTAFDVYNPAYAHGGQLQIEKVGEFRLNEDFRVRRRSNMYWIRRNMTGVTFKSAVVVPHLIEKEKLSDYLANDEHREINSQHRFQAVTVQHCRDMFNFTLNVIRTDSWGYMQKSGHFNGLVGLLERKEVDFGSSPLLYKLDRLPVVGYSFGNWILKSTFIYRRPKTTQSSSAIFLQPLSNTVWYALFVSMAIIVGTLHFMCGIEVKTFRKLRRFLERSWSSLILTMIACLCQQGFHINLGLLSNRIAALTVLLFSLLVYQFYSANIVSLLLRIPPRAINTIEDLRDSNLRLGVEDIGIDRAYFAETSYVAALDMYAKKIKNSNNNSGFYDPVDGLALVKKGGFAFHVETSTAYPIIEKTFNEKQICDLEEVQMYRTQPMHTNLQKGSPFKEMMTHCMMKLVEDGEMYRLRRHWDFTKPECLNPASGLHPVGEGEFVFALTVIGVAICISIFLLLIEILEKVWIHYKNGRMKIKSAIHPFVY